MPGALSSTCSTHSLDRKRYHLMVIFKEEEYVNSVVEVTKVSDRYMSLKLEVEGVLSVCMAQKMDVNRKRERNYGVTWTGEQNGVLRCWVGIVLRKEMQTAREQWIFQRDKKKLW